MRRREHQGRNAGFTLVEMVTVIIILGILAVGITSFIVFGTRIFVDSTSIDQVLSQSRFALERMTRDIRNAAPNSVRVDSGTDYQCLELVPIEAASNYLQMPVFPEPAATTGTAIVAPAPINDTMFALIYPLTSPEIYNGLNATTGKLYSLASNGVSTASGITTFTFSRAAQFAEASPRQRLFLVSQPISYCFKRESGTVNLYRYAGYGFSANQPAPGDMGTGVLMAEGIANNLVADAPISLEPATLVNNAMVMLTPEFEAVGQGFRYQQQVQVVNVP